MRGTEGFKFNALGVRENLVASFLEFRGNTYYVINNILVKNYYIIDDKVFDFGDDGVKRDTVLDKRYIIIGGNTYYVISNIIVKNYFIIDGKVIDFGDDGIMRDTVLDKIIITISGDRYYVINNLIQFGYQLVGDNIYDFGTDGRQKSEPLNKLYVVIGGNTYYVVNNVIVKNYYIIDDEVIDFGDDGVKRDTTLDKRYIIIGGNTYYVINNIIVKNYYIINDEVIDFGDDGVKRDTVLDKRYIIIGGNTYYVINNIIVKNYFIIDGKVIDFGDDGVKRDTTLDKTIVKVGNDNYYVKNNVIQTGKQLVGDNIYDFGTDGKQKSEPLDKVYVVIGGNTYYVINNVIVKNYYIINGEVKDFGDDGVKRDTVLDKTIVKVGNDNYYVKNNVIQTGNQLVGDKIYDFGTDGKQKDTVFDREIVVIGNNKYYAISGTIVVRTYVFVINHIYYFGDDGCALIGTTFGSYEFGDDGFITGSDIYIEIDGTLYEINDGIAKVHEHTYSDWILDEEPTCTEAGRRHTECTICGRTLAEEVIHALGHTPGDWKIMRSATCTEYGIRVRECTVCGEILTTEEIPALNHTYVNGVCSACGGKEPALNKETYRIEDNYIYFGRYPQTDVTESMSTVLSGYVSTLPTNGNDNGWTSYKYYIGNSKSTDFMWYKDVIYTDGNKYRAVYFTSYRPSWTNGSSSTGNSYQDDNGYTLSNVYWFRFDEIKWRILNKTDTTATILAELILDSQDYNYTSNNNGNNYANNYANSSIRKWLNDTFYNTAFNSLQQALINTVTVDNSARSTNTDKNSMEWNNGYNHSECANTQDKVWLLSQREVTRASYGFNTTTDPINSDAARCKQISAYSQCQGLKVTYKRGSWWLRSPHYDSNYYAHGVSSSGVSDSIECVNYTNRGVVPALQINLSEVHQHTPGNWVVDEEATCTKKGSKYQVCAECGETIATEEIPALGHMGSEKWIVSREPTCTEAGLRVRECTVCGEVLETEDIEAFGHEWELDENGEEIWTIVHDATCLEAGLERRTCSRAGCDYYEEREISALGHNYVNGTCTRCGAADPNYTPPTPSDETYRIEGNYIYFGRYPQTDVTATMGTALASYVTNLPANGNNNGWISYQYYIKTSNAVDYMWYKDISYTDGNKYRAVYFTSYRGYNTSNESSEGYTYQDDNGYTLNNVYWFRYDEIKWRILNRTGNTATILAELILDSQHYNYTTSKTGNNYSNNYANSSIRKWLNDTFYNTAFNSLQKALIKTVEVDNSERSTNPDNNATFNNDGTNKYACANTQDKVWLLSQQDVTRASYGFNSTPNNFDIVRRKQASLYAQCQGTHVDRSGDEYNGNSKWCLRSPHYDFDVSVWLVDEIGCGAFSYGLSDATYGIVPALKINLTGGSHEHTESAWIVDEKATCTKSGSQHKECTECGEILDTKDIPTIDHTPGWWVMDKEATCTETGSKHQVCAVCHKTLDTEEIPMLYHTPGKWIDDAEATCTKSGSRHTECTMCGETIATEEIPALEHNYVSGVCSVCGAADPNYVSNATEGLEYTLNEDGQSYSCTGIGTATATDIVIASEYNGLPVTSIGLGAFNHANLTSVVIGNNVTMIDAGAFGSCAKLTSVAIGNNVTSIGLEAFINCTNLTSVEIGNKVTSIGIDAFAYCKVLMSIEIPDSVTSIGEEAFAYCTNLTSIEIPEKVISIGFGAFAVCQSLTSLTVKEGNSTYYSVDNCIIETATKTLVAGCNTSVIPSDGTVTSIGNYAFLGCVGFTSMEIPSCIESIGTRAFAYCNGLTSLTVESGNSVYHSAGNCIIETATKTLLAGCSASIIPNDGTVTSIGAYAFAGIDLTTIEIPGSVTSIGDSAFYGCSSLTAITIPDGVTSIGEAAFYKCIGLTSIKIPDNVTSIGQCAFAFCDSLTSVIIGKGVKTIGNSAFEYCSSLTSIIIPDNVTSLGAGAFWICRSLASAVIGKGITSISEATFSDCENLTSIAISDSVTSIEDMAFLDCISLTSIVFEGTMAQWKAIYKGDRWSFNILPDFITIKCTDGNLGLND